MKQLTIFYLENCPFCKKAFRYIEELKQENPDFANIEFEKIEESQQPELADKYDYYYVPTFYIDGVKIHEGGIYKPEMREILRKVIS